MQLTNEKINKIKRSYYPENLEVTNWENVQKEYEKLLEYKIESPEDIIKLIEISSEFDAILDQEMAWKYIKMTCYSDQEKYEKDFNNFYAEIISKTQPYDFKLKNKLYNSPEMKKLSDKKYNHLKKIISNSIELYRDENVPLFTKEQELTNKYGSIFGKLTIDFDGEEKTITQMGIYLKDQDRSIRKKAWELINSKIKTKENELNELYDELRKIRAEEAKNAGFENYRDFKHQQMGRFSYTPEDIFKFHEAVEKVVMPFVRELTVKRKKTLGLDSVKPWDTAVDLDGKILKPFEKVEDLIDNSMKILNKIKPEYGIQFNMMKNTNLLDLENRKGKSPGGYNYPLAELGSSFIFMNAIGLHRDVVTLLHESGHAMHSKAISKEKISYYKSTPSEVAELASMSMELMTMEYWDEFYKDEADLKKAKRDQLEGTLSFLPWCMTVDAFQQWVYTHPKHTVKEREDFYISLLNRFDSGIDWTGLEDFRKISWMRQLHIFEVPFYYIEYGMSQLGALAIYKNYKENGAKAIEQYQDFLNLGYSKPVNELYEAAGIKFDFSEKYISELVDFVKKELNSL